MFHSLHIPYKYARAKEISYTFNSTSELFLPDLAASYKDPKLSLNFASCNDKYPCWEQLEMLVQIQITFIWKLIDLPKQPGVERPNF
jgi:hypothetical protein